MSYDNYIDWDAKEFLKNHPSYSDIPEDFLQGGITLFTKWLDGESGEILDLYDGNEEMQLDGVMRYTVVYVLMETDEGEERDSLIKIVNGNFIDEEFAIDDSELQILMAEAKELKRKESKLTPAQEKRIANLESIKDYVDQALAANKDRNNKEVGKCVTKLKAALKKL